MNELENLFKEKLGDHKVAPRVEAWSRIEAGLLKKNSSLTWMRWAAILIPGALITLLFLYKPDKGQQFATQRPNQIVPTIPNVPGGPKAEPAIVIQPVAGKPNSAHKKKSITPIVDQGNTPLTEISSSTEEMTLVIEPAISQAPLKVVAEPKPIVLVFTLDPITSTMQPEEKKMSLGRVVEFANTVKHSDPLSDLRGMKDELLAINWRKKSPKKN